MKNAITFHSATRGIHLRGAGVANLRIRGGECVLASAMLIAVDASVNATG
jgi:hypothetical protein